MTSANNSIGNDTPADRVDANKNVVPDVSERNFAESAEVQKAPTDAPQDAASNNAEDVSKAR